MINNNTQVDTIIYASMIAYGTYSKIYYAVKFNLYIDIF